MVPSIPFRSGGELLNSDYLITIEKFTPSHHALETAQSGILKQLWDTKFPDKDFGLKNSFAEIVAETPGGYTMVVPTEDAYSLQEYRDCLLTDTGYTLLRFDNAFAFIKGSPLRDLFNNAMRKIIESGELKKSKARHHIAEPECDGSRGRSLGFKNVAFAFVLFCGGVAFCMLLLVFEVFMVKIA